MIAASDDTSELGSDDAGLPVPVSRSAALGDGIYTARGAVIELETSTLVDSRVAVDSLAGNDACFVMIACSAFCNLAILSSSLLSVLPFL